ncbi:S41 family peptidase [Nonomuraea sp. B10E15]|uniref:S41 family peptidase n=1 Tax=Nonomuraea sp. B10E15 TaxID=3153560 RepID=UPI00325CC86C
MTMGTDAGASTGMVRSRATVMAAVTCTLMLATTATATAGVTAVDVVGAGVAVAPAAGVGAVGSTGADRGVPPCAEVSGQPPSGGTPPGVTAKPSTTPSATATRTKAAESTATATGITTVEQAYSCVLDHYYARDRLDHRDLLAAAFGGMTVELARLGLDRPDAVMPPLRGDRAADWDAFAATYERVTAALSGGASRREALAAAAVKAMVAGLHDNHVRWARSAPPSSGPRSTPEPGERGRTPSPGDRRQASPPTGSRRTPDPGEPQQRYGLGIATSYTPYHASHAPHRAQAPLHITAVTGGPAAERGLRAGDIIEAVNGAPLFAGGVLSTGALSMLFPTSADADPVRLTLRRPATGRTWAVTLKPERFTSTVRNVTATLLGGDVAAVRAGAFMPGTADEVRAAISELGRRAERGQRAAPGERAGSGKATSGKRGRLRGVVLDLRGNTGGSPDEVARLLGALAHGKVTGYTCDPGGACDPHRTDDTVPLLNLPVALLTDGICASACDHFTGAVKRHRLGPVIGTRTSGMVSGVAYPYALNDGSTLILPTQYGLGPNREIVNGIGVPPDHFVPRTAEDLSAGRDPAMTKALTLLREPS